MINKKRIIRIVITWQIKYYKDCDYLTNKGLEERRSVWQPWRPQVADCCSPAFWSYKKDFPFSGKNTWQNLDDCPRSGNKTLHNFENFFSGKTLQNLDDCPLSGKTHYTILIIFLYREKTWENLDDCPLSGKNITQFWEFSFSGKSMTKFGWVSSFWKHDTTLRNFLFMEKTWQNLDNFPKFGGKKNCHKKHQNQFWHTRKKYCSFLWGLPL